MTENRYVRQFPDQDIRDTARYKQEVKDKIRAREKLNTEVEKILDRLFDTEKDTLKDMLIHNLDYDEISHLVGDRLSEIVNLEEAVKDYVVSLSDSLADRIAERLEESIDLNDYLVGKIEEVEFSDSDLDVILERLDL